MEYLFLDTADRDSYRVAVLNEQGDVVREKKEGGVAGNGDLERDLLPAIDSLISGRGMINQARTEDSLKGILVVTGPGGFTSLRLGVTVANTLGWSMGIPVVGIKKVGAENFQPVQSDAVMALKSMKEYIPVVPEYGSDPNITLSKR